VAAILADVLNGQTKFLLSWPIGANLVGVHGNGHAQRAEERGLKGRKGWFLGRRCSPVHQLVDLGSAVSSPVGSGGVKLRPHGDLQRAYEVQSRSWCRFCQMRKNVSWLQLHSA